MKLFKKLLVAIFALVAAAVGIVLLAQRQKDDRYISIYGEDDEDEL